VRRHAAKRDLLLAGLRREVRRVRRAQELDHFVRHMKSVVNFHGRQPVCLQQLT
jgi:hypothetical protein